MKHRVLHETALDLVIVFYVLALVVLCVALFGTMASAGWALLYSAFFVVPSAVLVRVATARGQSRAYLLWGALGVVGLAIGLLMMMAMPKPATVPPSSGVF